jgi:ribokinase
MSIVVIGSSNSDMVVRVPHIPKEGETVMGNSFQILPGGKGANQAVAAARLGTKVTFIASIGTDDLGNTAIKGLKKEHIDIHAIYRPEVNSGTALIFVSDSGQNSIAVSPESNALLTPQHMQEHQKVISNASYVLAQLETPIETVLEASKIAKTHKVPFVLNPAPAQPLPKELLKNVSILTPNETEASILSGIEVIDKNSAIKAGKALLSLGIKTIVITMGANGVLLIDETNCQHVEAHSVTAIDTTAAGDTFNGALVHALSQNNNINESIIYANAASALSVTKFGAQPSVPYKDDVTKFLRVLLGRS